MCEENNNIFDRDIIQDHDAKWWEIMEEAFGYDDESYRK